MPAHTTEVVKKILLIGENPDVVFFTGLQQQGYEVAASESPMKAWCLIRVFRPHFIIVHFRQPARRDIAVLQECRAMAEGVPIIITASTPGSEAVMKALEEGATAFLSLPVEPAVVKKFLHRLHTAHK